MGVWLVILSLSVTTPFFTSYLAKIKMPHIHLPPDYPGIRSLFVFRPETAEPLCHLVQVLLHDPHPTLSAGERELIASYVSNLNTCKFCTSSHSAIAKHQLNSDLSLVKHVINDPDTAP